jgi:hypothetical protein
MTVFQGPEVLRPANVGITDPTCVADGMGMATLSTVITILRTDAETILEVKVMVNGNPSPNTPTERTGSPTTPGPGMKEHTYDWSEAVACGQSYSVEAEAKILLELNPKSQEKNVTCPACEDM